MRFFALSILILGAAGCTIVPPTIDLGQPYIVTVAPSKIPTTGSSEIVVGGVGFVSGAQVTVGGASCGGVQVQSASVIVCTPAAHSAGSVDVVVTNPNQRASTLSQMLSYYNPAARAVAELATVSGGGIATGPGYRLEFSIGGSLPPKSTGSGFQELAGLFGVLYGP